MNTRSEPNLLAKAENQASVPPFALYLLPDSVIFPLYFVIFPRFGSAAVRDLFYDRSKNISSIALKGGHAGGTFQRRCFSFSRKAEPIN